MLIKTYASAVYGMYTCTIAVYRWAVGNGKQLLPSGRPAGQCRQWVSKGAFVPSTQRALLALVSCQEPGGLRMVFLSVFFTSAPL